MASTSAKVTKSLISMSSLRNGCPRAHYARVSSSVSGLAARRAVAVGGGAVEGALELRAPRERPLRSAATARRMPAAAAHVGWIPHGARWVRGCRIFHAHPVLFSSPRDEGARAHDPAAANGAPPAAR